MTEGFDRKMKLIQRKAYDFKNYRLRVIAQCGQLLCLTTQASPSFDEEPCRTDGWSEWSG